MKHLFTIVLLLWFSVSAFAQDYIFFRNGDELRVKVQEISPTEIKYKKYSNQQGPTYSVPKKDVEAIQYENGDKETFNSTPATRQGTTQRQPNRKDNDEGSSGEVGIKFGGLYKLGLEIYKNKYIQEPLAFVTNDLSLGFKTKHYQFGIGTGFYYGGGDYDDAVMFIPFYLANRGYLSLPNNRVTPLAFFDIGFVPFLGSFYGGEVEFYTVDSDYPIVLISAGMGVAFGQRRTFQIELGYKGFLVSGDDLNLFRLGLVAAF